MKRLVTLAVALMPSACHAASDAFQLASRYETTPMESFNAIAVYAAAGFFLMALAQMQTLSRLESRRRKIEEALSRLLAGL